MALKSALKAKDTGQAELLIQRLSRQKLSTSQQAEWQLSRADLAVMQSDYQSVIEQLNFRSSWKLDKRQWQEYYELRAEAFLQLEQFFESSRALSELYKYTSLDQHPELSQRIWQNLSQYSQFQITQYSAEPQEEVLDGWHQLAVYTRTLASTLPQLKNTLEQWLIENPSHPASLYTPVEIQDILNLEISKPVNTALILPLSGKFAKQAQLIRDGFVLAMMSDDLRDENATLSIIDSNQLDINTLESTLIERNVDFVVGPLLKENIESLQVKQSEFSSPVPMLALNIPDQIHLGTQTCYLALSPEQEVAQAAKHLFSQGYQFPLILAPQGRLGQRVVEAFEVEWKKYSDNAVAVNLFGNKRELQKNINNVFGLQDSQQHIAQMESLLGIDLESQPRSRRDVDAVYIVANSAELTLIKPFIEVAVNPDTNPPKLFSNSRSNNGRKQYEDLSGVTYSDIPLLIQTDTALKAQMDNLWPKKSNAEKRLQALGMDAYLLMEHLPQMKVIEGYQTQGQTGTLSIDDQCVVQREVSWSEYGAKQPE